MSASGFVFALVLVGYNSITHSVSTADTMSYHLSHSDCITEETYQNSNGRTETHNRSYVCLRVYDPEMKARLDSAHGSHSGFGYRSGGRIVIELGR